MFLIWKPYIPVLASPPSPSLQAYSMSISSHLKTLSFVRCAEVSEQRSTSHTVSRGPEPYASSTPTHPSAPPPPPPFSRPTWGWGGEGISATGQRPLILWSVQWIELLGWGWGGGGEGGWNFIIIMCWSLFWLSHLWVANWPNIWLHNSKGAE